MLSRVEVVGRTRVFGLGGWSGSARGCGGWFGGGARTTGRGCRGWVVPWSAQCRMWWAWHITGGRCSRPSAPTATSSGCSERFAPQAPSLTSRRLSLHLSGVATADRCRDPRSAGDPDGRAPPTGQARDSRAPEPPRPAELPASGTGGASPDLLDQRAGRTFSTGPSARGGGGWWHEGVGGARQRGVGGLGLLAPCHSTGQRTRDPSRRVGGEPRGRPVRVGVGLGGDAVALTDVTTTRRRSGSAPPGRDRQVAGRHVPDAASRPQRSRRHPGPAR